MASPNFWRRNPRKTLTKTRYHTTLPLKAGIMVGRKHARNPTGSMEYTNDDSWVSTSEGAEITGYYQPYVQKLARDNWNRPEAERFIKVRKRKRGYDIWLPDLMQHMRENGIGPQTHIPKNE
jgi:hypothetical protein